MNITGPIRVTDRIIEATPHTAPVTLPTLATARTQVPSLSKLAIDLIILAAPVTMWAEAIMSGGRDTGRGVTGEGSGFTAAML